MVEEKRNDKLDIVRGIAIFLVVLGHAIQKNRSDFDNSMAFTMIYSFHMPLFMFVSGILAYGDGSPNRISFLWLKKRFWGLVIPFFAWVILPLFFTPDVSINNITADLLQAIKRPDGTNWFLWILFWNCVALFLCKKIKDLFRIKYIEVPMLVFILVLNIANFLIRDCFLGIFLLAWHIVFYFAGYEVAKNKQWLKKCPIVMYILLSLLFLTIAPFWKRVETPEFLMELLNYGVGNKIVVLLNLLFRYVVAFLGIVFSFTIAKWMPTYIKMGLAYLGTITMEIYVLHRFWFGIIQFRMYYISIVTDVILGLSLSIIIAYIVKRGFLSGLLFGKKSEF